MRSNRFLIISLLLFLTSAYLSSFSVRKEQAINITITGKYHLRLDSLSECLARTKEAAINLRDESSLSTLRSRYIECRQAFKKTEYLSTYLDAEFVKDHLNGPPLLHLERNTPNPDILEPEGLQILDELIYSENAVENRQHIIDKLNILTSKFSEFRNNHHRLKLTSRQILEASRLELVRIFTLGLTGFDTPGSGNALSEAKIALATLLSDISPYLNELKDPKKAAEVKKLFTEAIHYIDGNPDFETFDRYHFLVSYINPLYGQLLDVQVSLNIETAYESLPGKHSLNYFSRNIFDTDFLNTFYYTSFNESKYTPEVVKLGKVLFFDPVLSGNNKRSCASCHNPEQGFTDSRNKSIGFDFSKQLNRNSPTLVNAVFATRFFHDMRADKLETQVEHVFTSEEEFNTSFNEACAKLKKSEEYVSMFKDSFPWFRGEPVSKETVKLALAAYVQSLVALNSEFDLAVRENYPITRQVKDGFNLFMGKAGCGTCHFAPTFSGLVPPLYIENESEILGILTEFDTINPIADPDMGRFHNRRPEENSEIYMRSFKTPTVRNVSLTGPYMHNGAFSTLQEVMTFYNKGGGSGFGLQIYNQTLPPDHLNLSSNETESIIAFMKALTDTTGITSRPVRLPFVEGDPALVIRKPGGEY